MSRVRIVCLVSCLFSCLFLSGLITASGQEQPAGQALTAEEQAAEQLHSDVLSHIVHGRFGEARAAHDQLQAKYSTTKFGVAARVIYADIDLNQGMVDKALSVYRQAIELTPDADDKAVLYGKVGIALLRKGDADGAISHLGESLKRSTRWDDRTAAHSWLLQASMLKCGAGGAGKLSECGRESLGIALSLLGRSEDAEAVRKTPLEDGSGLSMAQMVDLVRNRGIDCWAVRIAVPVLQDITCPFVAHYGEQHFVVVTNVAGGKVSICDPQKDKAELPLEEFGRRFTGEVIVFARPDAGKGRELTLAEAGAVYGGCTTALPDTASMGGIKYGRRWSPEGDEGERNIFKPAIDSQFSIPFDVIPEIPFHTPLDGGLEAADPLRFAGDVTPDTHSGERQDFFGSGGYGGCSSCGGGGGRAAAGSSEAAEGGLSSDVTLNALTLDVRVASVPISYATGKGPAFQPLLTYDSKSTREESFGPKWMFSYDSRVTAIDQNTKKVTTPDGEATVFTYSDNKWNAEAGSALTLAVLGNNDVEVTSIDDGVKFTYDAGSLRLKSIADLWGQSLTISRSSVTGRVTKVTSADGRESTLQYNGSNRCTKITSALSDTATFLYNAGGALTRVTDMAGTSTSYYYNSDNYLTKRTDPLGSDKLAYVLPDESSQKYKVTYTSRDSRQRYVHWNASDGTDTLVQYKRGSNDTVSFKPSSTGMTYKVKGGSGQGAGAAVETYSRDANGFTTKFDRKFNGTAYGTTYLYDANSCLTRSAQPSGLTRQYGYDGNYRVTTATAAAGTTQFFYDGTKALTKLIAPDGTVAEYMYDSNGLLTRYEDRLGRETLFEYNTYGYLTRSVYDSSEELKYETDLRGAVTKFTDPLGNSTAYYYDSYQRITKAVLPGGADVSRTFTCCSLTSVKDAAGRTISYSYDNDGTLTKVTEPDNSAGGFLYDDAYSLTKETDALGSATTYSYTSDGAKLTKITLPTAGYYTVDYDAHAGMLTREVTPFGLETTYLYAYGSLLTKETSGTASTEHFYDASDRITKTNETGRGSSYFYYDQHGRVTKSVGARDAYAELSYDSTTGLVTRATNSESGSRVYSYDSAGRVTKLEGPEDRVLSYLYDASGRLTQASNGSDTQTKYYSATALLTKASGGPEGDTTYEYDSSGRLTKTSDAAGVYSSFALDANGRVTRSSDALSNNTDYSLDTAGRVTRVTDPSNRTKSAQYDAVGRVTKAIDPNADTTAYVYTASGFLTRVVPLYGKPTEFLHDQSGRLTEWRQHWVNGVPADYELFHSSQYYSYNPAGWITKKTDSYEWGIWTDADGWKQHETATRDTVYEYDNWLYLTKVTLPGPATVLLEYDDYGHPTKESAAGVTRTFAYDKLWRVTQVTSNYDSGTLNKSVRYVYDLGGRCRTMIDGQGTETTYDYTGSLLTRICQGGSLRAAYAYNDWCRLTKKTLGNDTCAVYSYDAARRITRLRNKKSDDSDISDFSYVVDPNGVKTKVTIGGSAYTAASVCYYYDAVYQLTKELRSGGDAFTECFWYDNYGKRMSKDLDSTVTTYEYDYGEKLTKSGTTQYKWDSWGNVTQIGGDKTYYWDGADRLTRYDGPDAADDTTYVYAPAGWERVKRNRNGTVKYFLWDDNRLLDEYNSGGAIAQTYLSVGLGGNVSTAVGGNTYYYLHDGIGSVRNVVDSSEAVQNTYDYSFHGNDVGSYTQAVANPFRFFAREYDSWQCPSYYCIERQYMPDVGLFMGRSRMPVGGKWSAFDPARGWGNELPNTLFRLYGRFAETAAPGTHRIPAVCQTVCTFVLQKGPNGPFYGLPVVTCALRFYNYLGSARQCIINHENVHVGQMRECCANYMTRRRECWGDPDPISCMQRRDNRWQGWVNDNVCFFELAAYWNTHNCAAAAYRTGCGGVLQRMRRPIRFSSVHKAFASPQECEQLRIMHTNAHWWINHWETQINLGICTEEQDCPWSAPSLWPPVR